MIDHFEATPLAVDGMVKYHAVRKPGTESDAHSDLVELFNILKNHTDPEMKQINISRSKLNVIRGIHVAPYHKIAFCPYGKMFDVCVDMRPNSPTFMKWDGCWLDKDTHVLVPPYCAHGVFAAEDDSVLCYYQGGCFFPHLDFAINPMDPQIGIKWPTPVNSDKYVLSEKDTNSSPVTPELVETLRFRIEHPIEDRLTNTNSDFVLICNSSYIALPILKVLEDQKLKAHLLTMTSFNRETLNARIVSLRPKYSVIYVLDTHGKNTADIFTEVMNATFVCHNLGSHITFILDEEDFPAAEELRQIFHEDCGEFSLIVTCKNLLSREMTKQQVANALKHHEKDLTTITDFDNLAEWVIEQGKQKKAGFFTIANQGKLDIEKVKKFCSENGVQINPGQGEDFKSQSETKDANAAFDELVSALKQ